MIAVYELVKWSFLSHDVLHPMYGLGYQFWSGIAGATAIFSGLYIVTKHKNCHEHRCWRIGRVHLADGTLACHKHDPRHDGSHKETGHVQRMWDQHLARHHTTTEGSTDGPKARRAARTAPQRTR